MDLYLRSRHTISPDRQIDFSTLNGTAALKWNEALRDVLQSVHAGFCVLAVAGLGRVPSGIPNDEM